jgi:CHAD domain-containing protein
MRLDAHLLHRTPVEGVRAVALALLDEAEQALSRIERAADEEALHDFRVALRRLRSTLRAFRPHLRGRLRRKHERRLRAFATITNIARDAEVQLAWLAAERQSLPPRALPGVDWLAGRREAHRRGGYEAASGRLAARFRRLAQRLARRLQATRTSRHDPQRDSSLGTALAELVRSQAAALDELLEVTSPLDVEQGHRARIAAKRLRYLLEPLRGVPDADAAPAVKILKGLQELLGQLHDAHVACGLLAASLVDTAAERARRAHAAIEQGASGGAALRAAMRDEVTRGLLVLDRRAVERATSAHQRLVREWLPRERAALAKAVAHVVQGLEAGTPRAARVRRRFLLMRLPEELHHVAGSEIEIGWLPLPRPQAWVSRVRDDQGVRFFRGEATEASEPSEEIPVETFEGLWPSTEGHRLRKIRRRVVDEARVWFVDELVELQRALAEVTAVPDEAIRTPRCLESLIVREVTNEKAYQDVRLAGRRRRERQRAPAAKAGSPPSLARRSTFRAGPPRSSSTGT